MEENEVEKVDTPVEMEDTIELDPNDFTDLSEEKEDNSSSEGTEQPTDEEVDTPVETKKEETKEVDFTPLFNELSKKVKFKDEEIKIENLDDVVTNYQKGKNYDTLKDKLNSLENSEELQYLNDLAKQNGMNTKDYIKAVKDYQRQQDEAQEQLRLQDMISKGVPEEVAKEVMETAKLRKQLNEEKLQLEKDKQEKAEKEKKDAEYLEFLQAYPDIKVDEIPKEVYENAKKTNFKSAYTEYLLGQTRKELESIKQGQAVKQTSPIKGTTRHGGIITEKTDPFMAGFDSV